LHTATWPPIKAWPYWKVSFPYKAPITLWKYEVVLL
jgi:hypothetical protein